MSLSLLLLLLSALGGSTSPLPASPCPQVFRYEARGGEGWFGRLTVPTFRPGPKLHVAVGLFVAAAFTNVQYGRLRLRGDRDETARRVFHQTATTVEYEVRFPVQSPLPQVELISVNDAVICRGSTAASRVATKIFLEHNLYPVVKQAPPHRPPDPRGGGSGGGDISQRGGPLHESEPCGVAAYTVRPMVARGNPVDRGEWPWLAALYLSAEVEFVCAGTLINLRHVVTAGHCIRGRDGLTKAASDVVVVLGKHDVTKWVEPRNQNRVITEVRVHPDFNYLTLANDIAALVLESRVEYTLVVRPVCLWDSDPGPVVGRVATVVGWGHSETQRSLTNIPNKVGVTIVSQEQCLRSHPAFREFTTERTICAGDQDGSGPCSGDSGGPLLLDKDLGDGTKQWHLRGIISLALTDRVNMTCDLNEYVVYTDVAKYLDWLRQFTLD